jgi:putative flippase GtrA
MSPSVPPSNFKTKAYLLIRYAISGSVTSLVYILVYNGALMAYQQVMAGATISGVVRFLCSNLGYGCALLVQYSAHGKFTFGHRQTRKGQLTRYLIAVGFGLIMAALFSAANTKLYVLPDPVVSLIVMILVAISNFFFFNFWVYADQSKHVSDGDENL